MTQKEHVPKLGDIYRSKEPIGRRDNPDTPIYEYLLIKRNEETGHLYALIITEEWVEKLDTFDLSPYEYIPYL